MDLEIAGRVAIVTASSHGLGQACALHLARAGCRLVMNGRDAGDLDRAADAIRAETGARVDAVAGNVGDPATHAALIDAADGQADILVNNNGGPPARPWRELDEAAVRAGIEANMVAPIALVRGVVDGMVARRWGRIVCITSGSAKMPLPGLDLSSGARLGLTGFLAGVARDVAGNGVTINFLLPGAFDTRRIAQLDARAAERDGITAEEARMRRFALIPARRLGRPSEFGAACAFLCSTHAGYLTGQSLLIDGGAYPGVL
ncbi:MAG: SDR family oxidoreductase [Janthinobacterium lividum]